MQLGGSSVLEISSPEMAVMAPQQEAAPSELGGAEVVEMEVGANNNNSSGELEEKGERVVVVVGGGGDGDEGGDDDDKISTSFGGNRWPRQETLALLKIRSDMDAVFRDSSLKGPLWEEVSRKLAELGYHRSAKKCKEKFENVYKYHKRTKESRSGKSEGKTYKFFDQLQALENHNHHPQFSLSYQPKPQPVLAATTKSDGTTIISQATSTFPSTNSIISPSLPPPPPTTTKNATTTTTTVTNTTRNQLSSQQPNNISTVVAVPHSLPKNNNNNNMNQIFSSPSSTSTSSSTASDEGLEERYRKKRKWKDYFRRLTRKVLTKQEEMQKRFFEAIDKRERERVVQEDSWRMQELARINKEHEILVQERSNAAAKDAAVIALLHKLSGQENPQRLAAPLPKAPQQPPPSQVSQPSPCPQPPEPPMTKQNNFEIQGMNNAHTVVVTTSTTPMRSSITSSSRWPKAEIHALIRLRTSLEPNYQENGPKAPLWEDISAGMQRLGYSRSAKRCKEKWENINKYFKKVKESNKQRREDSKTCPYFHELDALHREKSKNNQSNNNNPFGSFQNVKSNEMMMEPLMVQPEQQWRPPPQYHDEQLEGVSNNKENTTSQHQEKEAAAEEADLDEDEYVDGDIEEEDEDSIEDDEGAGRYEIVTKKLSSVETQLNETR